MNNCIFCQIIKKEIPAKIRYEDGEILAFDDASPKAKVHILIIPKKHLAYLDDTTEKDANLLGKMVLMAAKLAKENNLTNGYRVIINNKKHAGQVVDHLHLHLVGGQQLGPMA